MQNTEKNHPGSVGFYDTRPGNEVGLFYNAPETTQPDRNRDTQKQIIRQRG